MGSRSGIGSRGSDRDRGREKFAQAAANLYNAINKGDKASIAKATAQLSSHIAKMPTERLEAFAKSSSDAVWLTRKENNPKSAYNAKVYKHNTILSKLLNTELNKRR